MDSKLLLVKCITLLYTESHANQINASKGLVQKVIDTVKIPESSTEMDNGRELLISLFSTVRWMFDNCHDKPCDKTQLLQRLRLATRDDTYLYDAITDVIDQPLDESILKNLTLSYRSMLKDYVNDQLIKETITQAFKDSRYGTGEKTDYRNFVRELVGKLEPFTHDTVDEKHPSIVDSVSFDNDEDVKRLLRRSVEETSDMGTLVTGWQCVNRMLGESGGFKRGEMVVVGALQHNFKTGFTMNLFKHFALYNKPFMRDERKKPLLVHLSLENELADNVMWLYANLLENETGVECDIRNVDVDSAMTYIKKAMGVNGYHIEMMRLDPSKTSFYDIIDILTGFEAKGYEIHATICDYLSMVNRLGLDRTGPTGTEIRQLFRILRNFSQPRGITFITPHQLSTEAKALVRQGVDNFVKEIANKGYYEGSRQIDQEVDLELYVHKEIVNKVPYLTIQRGKHRKIKITPEKHLYTVLPFQPVGGICDDLGKDDTSRTSLGGSAASDGGADWFDV